MKHFHPLTVLLAAMLLPMGAAADTPVYTVPFSFTPTQAQYNECVVEDLDGDGSMTTYDSSEHAFKHSMSYQGAISDDYLFMPGIQMAAGTYKLSYEWMSKTDRENYSIVLSTGTASTTVVQTIVDRNDAMSADSWTTETMTFDVTEAGIYHLGIHVYSPNGRWNQWWRNFSVSIVDPQLPRVPVMTISPDGLDLSVTLQLPTLTVGGSALTGTLTGEISVDGTVAGTLTGAPGATVSGVYPVTSGEHQVTAVVKATAGGSEKVSEIVSESFRATRKCPTPMTLPVTLTPDEDEFLWCQVINSNDDTNTWEYCSTGTPEPEGGAFRYNYSWTKNADDWLILPVTEFPAGAFEVTVSTGTKFSAESYEICWASEPTPEALQANVIGTFSKNLANTWETVKARMTVLQAGQYYVAFHATSLSNSSYLYLRDIQIKEINGRLPAIPTADTVFDGGDGAINITFPATDISGAPLTATSLTATIVLDSNPDQTSTVSGAPGATVSVPCTGLARGNHDYSVKVSYERDGSVLESDMIYGSFVVGLPSTFAYQMPVELTFDAATVGDLMIVNANGDDKTLYAGTEGLSYGYNGSMAADDWAFTAAIDITQVSRLLNVATAVRAQSTSYHETFEIWIGTAPSIEGMTKKLLDTEVVWDQMTPVNADFMLETPGKYYVGIHVTSKKNMYGIYFRNLSLTYTDKSCTTPGQATDITAVPDITGAASATVSFTMPVNDIPGEALDPEAELTATVASTAETKTVTGLPGSQQSVTLACADGDNTISVTVANENGDGATAYVTVKCGLDAPKTPVITKHVVSADNCSFHIEWNPVTEGVTGGPANPDGMFYIIWEWDPDDEDWYQLDALDCDETSYDYELSEGWKSTMSAVTVGIQAYNGMNSGSGIASADAVLGKPYALPMNETFADYKIHYQPVSLGSTLDPDYRPEWGLGNPVNVNSEAQCEDNAALIGRTSFNRGDSYVMLPKFTTDEMTAASFEAMIFVSPVVPEYTLVTRDAEGNYSDVMSFSTAGLQAGWHPFAVALPETMLGKEWVELGLFVNFTMGASNQAMIDGYRIYDPNGSGIAETVAEADGVAIIPVAGGVVIEGAEGETVTVHTTDGRLVTAVTLTAGRETLPLATGTYLVSAGTTAKIVAVR